MKDRKVKQRISIGLPIPTRTMKNAWNTRSIETLLDEIERNPPHKQPMIRVTVVTAILLGAVYLWLDWPKSGFHAPLWILLYNLGSLHGKAFGRYDMMREVERKCGGME